MESLLSTDPRVTLCDDCRFAEVAKEVGMLACAGPAAAIISELAASRVQGCRAFCATRFWPPAMATLPMRPQGREDSVFRSWPIAGRLDMPNAGNGSAFGAKFDRLAFFVQTSAYRRLADSVRLPRCCPATESSETSTVACRHALLAAQRKLSEALHPPSPPRRWWLCRSGGSRSRHWATRLRYQPPP